MKQETETRLKESDRKADMNGDETKDGQTTEDETTLTDYNRLSPAVVLRKTPSSSRRPSSSNDDVEPLSPPAPSSFTSTSLSSSSSSEFKTLLKSTILPSSSLLSVSRPSFMINDILGDRIRDSNSSRCESNRNNSLQPIETKLTSFIDGSSGVRRSSVSGKGIFVPEVNLWTTASSSSAEGQKNFSKGIDDVEIDLDDDVYDDDNDDETSSLNGMYTFMYAF